MAKLINNFNTNIYIPAFLPLINIISKEGTPLSFSKRIIIYTIDIEEIYILRCCSVANGLHSTIYLIRAPFSVAHFVISGGYHRVLFKYVIGTLSPRLMLEVDELPPDVQPYVWSAQGLLSNIYYIKISDSI